MRPPALLIPLALALALVLACAVPASAASSPRPARCEGSKLVTAARAALGIAKCHAAAARDGVAVDLGCLSYASAKLATGFVHADARPPCPTAGVAPATSALLVTLGSDLAAIAGAGPSKCDARKLFAAGKRLEADLKAEAAHAHLPERERLQARLTKADVRFHGRMTKAAAMGDCTHPGNTAAIAAITPLTDAAVTATVDLARGTLHDLAQRTGRTIGAAVRANVLAGSDVTYRDAIVRQLGAVTAEYEFMWGNVEPVRGTLLTAPIDTIVAFTQQHGLALKGAPLVWHLVLPPWVNEAMTPAELQAAVDERIDTLMAAYAGTVTTWDVVNEAAVDSGAALRDSIFLRKLGPDYIRNAFLRARQADPSALLFYNDFLADGLNAKSDFLYDLIAGLLAQGTPIDGVSFQMHLGGGFGPVPTRASIRANLKRFADLGLIVRVSEMDVQTTLFPTAHPVDLQIQQRIFFHDAVAACLDVAACDSISFWGITDKYTWVKDYLGIDDRPLPLDELYRPKAAFFGVRDALLGY